MTALISHPSLNACRRLFLRNHELAVHIGVHDFEHGTPQRIRFNVDLYVPLALSTPTADALDEVVDYDFIRQTIAQRVARGLPPLRVLVMPLLLREDGGGAKLSSTALRAAGQAPAHRGAPRRVQPWT